MKLKFLPLNRNGQSEDLSITESTIFGYDISDVTESSPFVSTEESIALGIIDLYWEEGELHAVVGQRFLSYGRICQPVVWEPSDWVDLADYTENEMFIKAASTELLSLVQSGKVENYFDLNFYAWAFRYIPLEEELE